MSLAWEKVSILQMEKIKTYSYDWRSSLRFDKNFLELQFDEPALETQREMLLLLKDSLLSLQEFWRLPSVELSLGRNGVAECNNTYQQHLPTTPSRIA